MKELINNDWIFLIIPIFAVFMITLAFILLLLGVIEVK